MSESPVTDIRGVGNDMDEVVSVLGSLFMVFRCIGTLDIDGDDDDPSSAATARTSVCVGMRSPLGDETSAGVFTLSRSSIVSGFLRFSVSICGGLANAAALVCCATFSATVAVERVLILSSWGMLGLFCVLSVAFCSSAVVLDDGAMAGSLEMLASAAGFVDAAVYDWLPCACGAVWPLMLSSESFVSGTIWFLPLLERDDETVLPGMGICEERDSKG